MRNPKLDQLINQVENYLECWKQFNRFINLGHEKRFTAEDDLQFLELKSVLIQELELILASVEVEAITKEEIHTLVGAVPSLHTISELTEGAIRNIENQWHRIYIGWHSVLGQLKVRQRQDESKCFLSRFFSRKKKD